MASQEDRIFTETQALSIPEEPLPSSISVAPSLTYSESADEQEDIEDPQPVEPTRRRRASTRLIVQNAADVQRITGESTRQLVQRCCGGGCSLDPSLRKDDIKYERVPWPENDAYRSLLLKVNEIPTTLSNVVNVPEQTAFLLPLRRSLVHSDPGGSMGSERADAAKKTQDNAAASLEDVDTTIQPPRFVQPHPPHHVVPVPIQSARELTRPGAAKRTFHFDLDITDYPVAEGVDFQVGGAIGIMAPNDDVVVDEVLDLLSITKQARDKPVLLRTTKGRWPTVWGDDRARELVTSRRDLLTWCSDLQSYPPTKQLLRVLAEYAADENERKMLMFLSSAEGQGAFCDFRTGPHVSLVQLLSAFPSSTPPLDLLLSVLQPLMPRFYSLSNDPHESFQMRDGKQHRLIEIAVTVHETDDWRAGSRTGIGSGFMQRQALQFLENKEPEKTFFVPMFKGLMANPLAKQFVSDGPMLLIGAGVGIAPFRGFVQRRLKTANCANKVWVLQGVRDSLLDELYSGEWGVHEDDLKRVVESRRGEGRYVQEEVRHQADLVWFIINSLDGRVFVCGSTKGMGEGVLEALIDVAMHKGNLGRDEAKKFWHLKSEVGQYIAETW